jgi:c(7)-type cytochrome triheme protein
MRSRWIKAKEFRIGWMMLLRVGLSLVFFMGTAFTSDSLRSESIASVADYSKFSHSSPNEHAALTKPGSCASCHRANGAVIPTFPRHRNCTNCHLVQFTVPSSASTNPICTICHIKEGLSSSNPPINRFPALRSFTVEFDHAQHLEGVETAKPQGGCSACHVLMTRGFGQSIPAGVDAHRTCYECHAPGKQASNLAACDSCHKQTLERYSPTPTSARAYSRGFSHANHTRNSCQNCHIVKGRGLPQTKQVTSISPVEHLINSRAPSCKTCHDGRRAFGDTNTRDCKRCHKREGFRMSS